LYPTHILGDHVRYNMDVAAVILCGGKGSRMLAEGEQTHKPLLEIKGVPSTKFVINKLIQSSLHFAQIIVVVPKNRESEYEDALFGLNCIVVSQELPLGTGNAVYTALDFLNKSIEYVYVSFGTQPLIRNETVEGSLETHIKGNFGFTLATVVMDNPYAPLIRNDLGDVIGSFETHLDGAIMLKKGETNVGSYWASRITLDNVLVQLHQELYLPEDEKYDTISGEFGYPNEMVKGCLDKGIKVEGALIAEEIEMMGIKTPETLDSIRRFLSEN